MTAPPPSPTNTAKQATYRFQVIQGIKRIVAIEGEPSPNCPSSNSTFTYDDQGLLTSKRDNNGNLTTYQYNARGLETSRTEAAGTRRRAPSQPTGTRPCSSRCRSASPAGSPATSTTPRDARPARPSPPADKDDTHAHPPILPRLGALALACAPRPARAGGRARLELQLQRLPA